MGRTVFDPTTSDSVPSAAAFDAQAALDSMADTATLSAFLDELVQLAARDVPGVDGCALTMQREHRPVTVSSSNALAAAADESQYAVDEGPCLESLRTGTVVSVEDTASDQRWHGYPAQAAAIGVGSSVSLPIVIAGQLMGALNLYSRRAHSFDLLAQHRARAWADQAVGALGLAVRLAAQTERGDQLAQALVSRSSIDQALGILMSQQRCSPEAAFALLSTASQHRNRKLRDLAQDMVDAQTRP